MQLFQISIKKHKYVKRYLYTVIGPDKIVNNKSNFNEKSRDTFL